MRSNHLNRSCLACFACLARFKAKTVGNGCRAMITQANKIARQSQSPKSLRAISLRAIIEDGLHEVIYLAFESDRGAKQERTRSDK